jgi:hypothetical protein
MTFELLPILDLMLNFYQKPRDANRFQEYLKILRGNTKDDLVMPIGGFNPMAKEHVFEKLMALKTLNAEDIMREVIKNLNEEMIGKNEGKFKVALNLCDDFLGGWTNRYTTDFDSKFKLNALVKRQFCTPIFWSSESYNEHLIKQITLEYALRTIYWLEKPKPISLREHVEQEQFVIQNSTGFERIPQLEKYRNFYLEHSESDSYSLTFNFFYGNEASELLGFPVFEKRI